MGAANCSSKSWVTTCAPVKRLRLVNPKIAVSTRSSKPVRPLVGLRSTSLSLGLMRPGRSMRRPLASLLRRKGGLPAGSISSRKHVGSWLTPTLGCVSTFPPTLFIRQKMEPQAENNFFDLGDRTALVCIDHVQYQKMIVP